MRLSIFVESIDPNAGGVDDSCTVRWFGKAQFDWRPEHGVWFCSDVSPDCGRVIPADEGWQIWQDQQVRFVNLTPHAINIEGGPEIPPSGMVARCAEVREQRRGIDGLEITLAWYGEVTGLPPAESGVAYIVSSLVLAAVPHREDVFAPGPAVRDEQGRIVACKGLSCTPAYNNPDNI